MSARSRLAERGPVWSTAAREQELWDSLPEGPTAGPRRSLVEGAWPGLVRPAPATLPDGTAWPLHDPEWPLVTRGWDAGGNLAAIVGIDSMIQETAPLMRTGASPDALLLLGPGGRALLRGIQDGIGWVLVAEGVRRWLAAEWDRAAEPVAIIGVPTGGEPALESIGWPTESALIQRIRDQEGCRVLPNVPVVLDGTPTWVRRVRRALPAQLDVRGLR